MVPRYCENCKETTWAMQDDSFSCPVCDKTFFMPLNTVSGAFQELDTSTQRAKVELIKFAKHFIKQEIQPWQEKLLQVLKRHIRKK